MIGFIEVVVYASMWFGVKRDAAHLSKQIGAWPTEPLDLIESALKSEFCSMLKQCSSNNKHHIRARGLKPPLWLFHNLRYLLKQVAVETWLVGEIGTTLHLGASGGVGMMVSCFQSDIAEHSAETV
eukprot:772763-Amphidinium_carterae.1